MKKTIRITAWTVALSLVGGAMTALQAQDETRPPHHGRRQAPPLFKALDVDGNGTIDASEIANASASLAKLDKNGDGNLTRDELRPEHHSGKGPYGGSKMDKPAEAATPAQ
jgi:hypothetical protein